MKLGRHLYDVTASEGAGNMQTFFMMYTYGKLETKLANWMYARMIRGYGNTLPINYKVLWTWGNWD